MVMVKSYLLASSYSVELTESVGPLLVLRILLLLKSPHQSLEAILPSHHYHKRGKHLLITLSAQHFNFPKQGFQRHDWAYKTDRNYANCFRLKRERMLTAKLLVYIQLGYSLSMKCSIYSK